MLQIRRAAERGHFNHGWLDTYHTFSFARYRDPNQMGFRSLRVMNEDRIAPGQGFGTHGHDNMEIVTYVLEGALEHKDSMGNGEVLRPGEFQRMSAGTGITHSEFNPSATEEGHLYQIWLYPSERGLEPSYEQKRFPDEELAGGLRLVAAPDAAQGALRIHQDARIYVGRLQVGEAAQLDLGQDRHAWVQVLRGTVALNGEQLETSDGAAVSEVSRLDITATEPAEVMVFDLA